MKPFSSLRFVFLLCFCLGVGMAFANTDYSEESPIQSMVSRFNPKKIAGGALLKADRLYRAGQPFLSDSLLQKALHYYEGQQPCSELTRLYFYTGLFYERLNQPEEALKQYTLAETNLSLFPDSLFSFVIARKIFTLQQLFGKRVTEDLQWETRYAELLQQAQQGYVTARKWRTACFVLIGLLSVFVGVTHYRTRHRKRELFKSQLFIERLQRAEDELKEKMSRQLHEKDGKLKDFFRLRVDMIKEFVEFSQKYANNPEKLKYKFQRTISTDSFSPTDWELLLEGVNITGNGIITYLQENYPDLTEENLRYCALICAGFETDELAILCDVNNTSIYKRRTRLRQKLNLSPNQDLKKFFDELIARLG
ncbi:hypothetical protein [Odoribacter lunatus]|uniref:hypothetical protein n=1 Tax=Odoribacter lunatus TaxID=2941335 RepID=UPI0020422A06|nr:hypothetical protein [Odoribacter lunatus]